LLRITTLPGRNSWGIGESRISVSDKKKGIHQQIASNMLKRII